MSLDIPTNVNDVTNEWLSKALGGAVTGFSVTFLEGGVLSDAFRIHDITYDTADSKLPESLVLKITNEKEDQRAVAVANGAYVREVRFFAELADDVPLRTPIIYNILNDGSDDYEFFSIAMEDLGAHSQVFDQIDDPPDEGYVRKMCIEVADYHAAFWESDTLKLDWLRHEGDSYKFPLHDAAAQCAANIDTFVELWTRSYNRSPFQPEYESLEPMTKLICEKNNAHSLLERIYNIWNSRPWTLIHNDLRADNLFRTTGQPAETGELTYIDWQLVAPGPAGPEFTQAWQHTLAPEVRRKDLEFLKLYHDRLVARNPAAASYTYDMLVEDYRLAFIVWWMSLMTVGAATFVAFEAPEAARMKALWGQGLSYMFQANHDHDCLELTRQLLE